MAPPHEPQCNFWRPQWWRHTRQNQPTGVWRLFRLAVAAPGWYRVSVADSLPPNSIFMCYRRDDSADVAGRIYDRLVAEFGKDAIYRDVDTIPFGEDFREHIHACLSTCRVGLVVIGPEWCITAGRSGRPRLHEPTDHVRLEVEAMLARGTMKTIPLYVRGAESPEPDALPEALQPLAFRNGADIRRDPDFHHDMDRVLAQLRRLVAHAAEKGASPDSPPMPEKIADPVVPPAPEPQRPPEPVPVARQEMRAADEPSAGKAPLLSVASARPGRGRSFVARLPGSRRWGWIWAGFSAITGGIFLVDSEVAAVPFFLTVLLSPLAAVAHWRDGRRGAAICSALYFTSIGIALVLVHITDGQSSSEGPSLGLVQLIHSVAWVSWSIGAWRKRARG